MDRHRYFIFNQKKVLVLGILQVACAGLCIVCGFMDAVFRKETPLSRSRTPMWGGSILASSGVLALFASQRKNSILVCVMMAAASLSCVASVIISGYSILTLTYGEEDGEVFHHHDDPQVTFILHGMVKGSNATILLSCSVSLLLSSLIIYVGSCSLPFCACYDTRNGLETLVPQCDPGNTEMVCTSPGGDDRLFNSPSPLFEGREEEESPAKLPPYCRLT